MSGFVSWICVLIALCFVAGLILEGTRLEKTGSKVIGIVVTVSLCLSVTSLLLNPGGIRSDLSDMSADSGYIENINAYKLNIIKSEIEKELEKENIKQSGVYFSTSFDNGVLKIEKVHIDLSYASYDKEKTNINRLKHAITDILVIDEENVLVYL